MQGGVVVAEEMRLGSVGRPEAGGMRGRVGRLGAWVSQSTPDLKQPKLPSSCGRGVRKLPSQPQEAAVLLGAEAAAETNFPRVCEARSKFA